jgi:opacity protein-like surface antigen
MKKSITLIVGALLFALVAGATDIPKFETFLGYTYLRTDLQSDRILGQSIGSFSMNGGNAQFIYNFNKQFSLVADLGAVHRGNVGLVNVDNKTSFFLFGPRVSHHTSKRFTPYLQILFGAAERSASKEITAVTDPNTPEFPVVTPHRLFPGPGVEVSAGLSASQTSFSMIAGGGVDFKISKRFAFRPIEVDYVLTTFPSLLTGNSSSQNGLRASTGFIFTFGER